MNKDQVKGGVKEVAGKIQEKTGKLLGSNHQQAKGVEKQISGKIQENVGDIKKAAKDARKGR
ncbi:MAG: CsbD family protein [Glaciimonas sp.]|nr:CsbD family protein [Glaciimonas sp.]